MTNSIVTLLKSKKTVFKMSDLAFLWNISNNDTLKSKIYYLVKQGKIIRLHQGIFALDNEFDKYELAGAMYNPSYVSRETVLRDHGIIFQYSTIIESIGRANKEYLVNNIKYQYNKIKDSVLLNSTGLISKDNYTIATKERAFLDTIYLNKNYYFDNLDSIDWEKCYEYAEIYENENLIKRLKKYHKDYVRQNKA